MELPQVGSALGKGLRSFKKGQAGEDEEEEKEVVSTKPKKAVRKKVAKG